MALFPGKGRDKFCITRKLTLICIIFYKIRFVKMGMMYCLLRNAEELGDSKPQDGKTIEKLVKYYIIQEI